MSIGEAEEEVMSLLKNMSKGAIICGNSIHWDRVFIRRQMPKVDKFCTFRMIDVSSFKELLRRIDPMRFQAPRKRSDHTALTDAKGGRTSSDSMSRTTSARTLTSS